MINMEDLMIRGPFIFPPVPYALPDFKKIIALSDEDFAEFYLKKMTEYKDRDGWWDSEGNKIPTCGECHTEILGPRQLVRYYGRSIHTDCFQKYYNKEEKTKGVMKKYWKRVANLRLSKPITS